MVRHTVHVWSESENRAGAEKGIAAIADTMLGSGNVSGDQLRPLKPLNQIALLYLCQQSAGKSAYYPVRGRISSPKIAGTPYLMNKGFALTFNPECVYDFRDAPLIRHLDTEMTSDFLTGFGYEVDESGVAHILSIVAIVSDGPIPKGPQPKIDILHHCTIASATGAASTWKESSLTETYGLGAGKYRMWGGRVVSPTAIAARFVFPQHAGVRPAVIPLYQENQPDHPFNTFWGLGVPFEIPGGLPNLEYMAAANETGSSAILYLEKLS